MLYFISIFSEGFIKHWFKAGSWGHTALAERINFTNSRWWHWKKAKKNPDRKGGFLKRTQTKPLQRTPGTQPVGAFPLRIMMFPILPFSFKPCMLQMKISLRRKKPVGAQFDFYRYCDTFGKNSQRWCLPNIATSKWWDTHSPWQHVSGSIIIKKITNPRNLPYTLALSLMGHYQTSISLSGWIWITNILFLHRTFLANYQPTSWTHGNHLRCISADDSIHGHVTW